MAEPIETPLVTGQDSTPSLLRYFDYGHLPAHLQRSSFLKEFSHLADQLVQHLPASSERTFALRKLLESKDCAVRAAL